MPTYYEEPIDYRERARQRVIIADRLAARGWSRNTWKFNEVVEAKLNKQMKKQAH